MALTAAPIETFGTVVSTLPSGRSLDQADRILSIPTGSEWKLIELPTLARCEVEIHYQYWVLNPEIVKFKKYGGRNVIVHKIINHFKERKELKRKLNNLIDPTLIERVRKHENQSSSHTE